MKHLKLTFVLFLVLAVGLNGCSLVTLPNVDPPATPVVNPTPLPEATYASKAQRITGNGLSTPTPLPSPSSVSVQGAPSAEVQGAVGSGTSSTSYALETSGALGDAAAATSPSAQSEAWIADAKGSLPSIQPVRMQAVWVATVLNIDFPTAPGDAETQKQECLEILDNVKSWGMDTVIFQARPMGDALYRSSINPWSHFLTGSQGTDPGWDPLEFMITEAHRRGLSLHVWLNPYRVIHSSESMTVEDLAPSSFAAQHPEWLIEYENGVYLDPAVPQVRQHIVDTVREIIDNYNVDGVHFDDYFYPSNYPLPQGAERDGILDRERRENVNEMIRMVHDAIKQKNERILFGISPAGIWKNASSDPEGSPTNGNESYYAQAADSLAWVQEGIIDYLAPQLYWRIGYELADYEKLVDWWCEKMRGTGVSLLIGQGIHYEEVSSEIEEQLALNALHPEITGSIYFSYQDLKSDSSLAQRIRDTLQS